MWARAEDGEELAMIAAVAREEALVEWSAEGLLYISLAPSQSVLAGSQRGRKRRETNLMMEGATEPRCKCSTRNACYCSNKDRLMMVVTIDRHSRSNIPNE